MTWPRYCIRSIWLGWLHYRQVFTAGPSWPPRQGLARDWVEALRSAFLDAYGASVLAAGLWPDAAALATQDPSMSLFEIELAVRELGDALLHRGAD